MDKRLHYIFTWLIFTTGILLSIQTSAQKYTFTHYDIESGLIQSQVNKIYQDNNHRLWIATLGGTCRFDGNEYINVTKATGLINNFVYEVFCDKQGTVWFGTNKGLACLKNQHIYNFPLPANLKTGWVTHIKQDAAGTIWLIIDNHLFKVSGQQLKQVNIDDKLSPVTTIASNSNGHLFAYVYNRGIYHLNKGTWQTYASVPQQYSDIYVSKLAFDKRNDQRIYVLAYRGVFLCEHNNITPYADNILKNARRPFLSMELDRNNNLWIGTSSGAYYLKNNKLVKLGADNGFSDVAVSDIYNDNDNNLWLGTQGNGIFRYDGDDYMIYNQSQLVKDNPIVMGLAHDKYGRVLLGIDGGGIALYDNQSIKTLWAPTEIPYARRIACMYTDKSGIVWIGTSMGGLWKYDGHLFTPFKGTENNTVNAIVKDEKGQIWLGTPLGLYYIDHDMELQPSGINNFCSSLLNIGKDSILAGTQEGVMLLSHNKRVTNFKIPNLGNAAILSLFKLNNIVFIGTDDRGIYIWNRKNNQIKNLQMRDGLKANSIYSMAADEKGLMWIGTGRGVSRFSLNKKTLKCTIISSGESKDRIIESNQNAILPDNNRMLVGTTKGLAVYSTALPTTAASLPYIIINNVKVFASDNPKARQVNPNTARGMVLSANQNHVSISFLGVYLKSPTNVSYQYKLTGLDNEFCAPVKNNMVDYPSLPAGKYTFEVKALNADGYTSKNTAIFNFEITPPFYKTYIFQLCVVLALIFIGVALQNFLTQNKLQRQRVLETLKREEKLKIRQQTAEDFHDDLGNKLTRITVLSDMLDAKLNGDKPEYKNLILQIKQNAAALYNGTKDILWAMDPKSDNLYEILIHIKEIGIEIFQDTAVNFHFTGINPEQTSIKLPMEYNRNISMIFKELLNNALKHAGATNVKIEFIQVDKNYARLQINDNGNGFDTQLATRGHGLNNIKSRAKRIDAQLTFTSKEGNGTCAALVFKLNKRSV